MTAYKTKARRLQATSVEEAAKKVHAIFRNIERSTHRKPYIKSAYFQKKVFLDFFWQHLNQKPRRERIKRLAYVPCAPVSKQNPNKSEILHRFLGETKEKEAFYIQIKENTRNHWLHLMSVFPVN